MSSHFAIADVAALVGEPTRAAILLALLDGSARPAGELARTAHLSASATSLHLAKLSQGGLLLVHRQGRHRYYRLANREVARALEALGAVATAQPPARSLSKEQRELRVARTCYDHLAGAVAVHLAELWEDRDLIQPSGERDYAITEKGVTWLAKEMQIEVASLPPRRHQARRCLDWTERRPHIAGALGCALLDRLLADRWVVQKRDCRAIRITTRGIEKLERLGLRASAFILSAA